jgi:hypothetical protein
MGMLKCTTRSKKWRARDRETEEDGETKRGVEKANLGAHTGGEEATESAAAAAARGGETGRVREGV